MIDPLALNDSLALIGCDSCRVQLALQHLWR